MVLFNTLTIKKWNQFESIEISFDKRFTILTGANGSGKTTILKLLAQHCQFQAEFHLLPMESGSLFKLPLNGWTIVGPAKPITVAELTTTNNKTMQFMMPSSGSNASYKGNWSNMTEHVPCVFIPSSRQSFAYTKVSQVQTVRAPIEASLVSNIQSAGGNVAHEIKTKLINWAISGFGNSVMPSDPEAQGYYLGFQELLKEVLPEQLGFQEIKIANYEIVLCCKDNKEFLLESVSSGIGTIISIAWRLYQYKYQLQTPFVIIIDEVEAHLHPQMQREFLHSLGQAFPHAKFVVSTHSPLIINSVQDAGIYVLAPNDFGNIVSERLDFQNHASTANSVLDEVLGVSSTYPIWVEQKLAEIVDRYSKMSSEKLDFDALKAELSELGLSSSFLPTMTEVMERIDD